MHAFRNEMTADGDDGVRNNIPRSRARIGNLDIMAFLIMLAAGVFIAKFVTSGNWYLILSGCIAIVLGMALVRNLQAGLLILVFIAPLALGETPGIQSPNSGYSAGLMPSQLFLFFLALLWVIASISQEGRLRLAKSNMYLPLMSMVGIAAASLIINRVFFSDNIERLGQVLIVQIAEVGLIFCSVLAFTLTINTLKEEKWIRRLAIPVIMIALYISSTKILGLEEIIPVFWGTLILAAGVTIVYAKLLFDRQNNYRTVWLALLLLILGYAVYSNLGWISGWLATTVAILIVTFYRSKAMFAAILAILFVVMFVYPGVFWGIEEESESGGDYDRFVIWNDAIHMFMAYNPLLGVGPGNFNAYAQQHSTIWFASNTYNTAHNNYVQIAAETGILGFLAFIWVIISGIVAGHRAARGSPPRVRWMAVAATAFFVGIAVSSIFGDYLLPSRGNNGLVNFGTTVYAWIILGAGIAARRLPERRGDGETG